MKPTDEDEALAQLEAVGWRRVQNCAPELKEHYVQGIQDGIKAKPLPPLYSRPYILGWLDGRIEQAKLKIRRRMVE
jgi:hypothetical protein